tara:strand:- start:294 stop:431 length:138 start_codon:yes stop_codon:yes gene_type:complete
MFGRKKKCKKCGKELIRPEDKMNGKWCEVCTFDHLKYEYDKLQDE